MVHHDFLKDFLHLKKVQVQVQQDYFLHITRYEPCKHRFMLVLAATESLLRYVFYYKRGNSPSKHFCAFPLSLSFSLALSQFHTRSLDVTFLTLSLFLFLALAVRATPSALLKP